jgi:dolichol-phosphate mannosyltransferase
VTDDAHLPHRAVPHGPPLPHRAAPEVTVVLPTYNERDNIAEAIDRVGRVLEGVDWEVIVVDDDSPDGTAALAKEIADANPRVRCIRRVGRRGLAGACIEGMLASAAPIVAVMDADLQHDEALLPAMLDAVRSGEADIAVGSRFADGAATHGLSAQRRTVSTLANALARLLLRVKLTDPMSGFFMLRREAVEAVADDLSTQGFKILLDIVVSMERRPRIVEFGYVFRERGSGESKLDALVVFEFVGLIVSKLFGGLVSVRFVLFALVGLSGVVVHLGCLRALLATGLGIGAAQAGATFVAMTTNFFLNNHLTYRDRRLKGWRAVRGLASFYAVCGIGVLANVGVAEWVYGMNEVWWVAGVAGALVGAVWNYGASAVVTWRVR